MEQEKLKIIDKKVDKIHINISYPQIEGLDGKVIQVNINTCIRKLAYSIIRELTAQNGKFPVIWGGYEIKLISAEVFSVVFSFNSYNESTSYSTCIKKGISLNYKSGLVYKFRDLFVHGSNYRDKINSIILQQIKNNGIYPLFDFDDVGEDPEFSLSQNNLLIYFCLHEHTQYSKKVIELVIPYYLISGIINPGGPLIKTTCNSLAVTA